MSTNEHNEGATQLISIRLSDIKPKPYRGDWGGWKLSHCGLEYKQYYIDLERFTDAGAMMHTLTHLANSKVWATNEVLGGLVVALHDLLRQVAFGRTATKAEIRAMVREYRRNVKQSRGVDSCVP
jgi:hypothetical protein